MHTLIPQSQLPARIEALGIAPTTLAVKAGLHHTTLLRVLNGNNCEVKTLEAVSRAVLNEEQRLRDHLKALPAAIPGDGAAIANGAGHE
jgi:predicted transcriptional regulator